MVKKSSISQSCSECGRLRQILRRITNKNAIVHCHTIIINLLYLGRIFHRLLLEIVARINLLKALKCTVYTRHIKTYWI